MTVPAVAPAEGAAPAVDDAAAAAAAAPAAEAPAFKPPASQAEFDAAIQARLAREQAKYVGFDDFKAKAEKFDAHEAANQSELEKAQAAATAAETKAAALEARFRETALRSAVTTEALKAGAVNPEQVLALLPKDAVTLTDDGTVTGAAEAVAAFLAANPHFVAATAPVVQPIDGAGATGSTAKFTPEQVEAMTPAEYDKNRDAVLASMATWK